MQEEPLQRPDGLFGLIETYKYTPRGHPARLKGQTWPCSSVPTPRKQVQQRLRRICRPSGIIRSASRVLTWPFMHRSARLQQCAPNQPEALLSPAPPAVQVLSYAIQLQEGPKKFSTSTSCLLRESPTFGSETQPKVP